MAKLRKHHEECFNRQKIAEEQRNAKERQHTTILLKRAQLAQKLAELDALVSNVNIAVCPTLFIMCITRRFTANLAVLDILCAQGN